MYWAALGSHAAPVDGNCNGGAGGGGAPQERPGLCGATQATYVAKRLQARAQA